MTSHWAIPKRWSTITVIEDHPPLTLFGIYLSLAERQDFPTIRFEKVAPDVVSEHGSSLA